MLYREMAGITWALMSCSIILLIAILSKRVKFPKFNRYAVIAVSVLSVVTLLWILFNKELFRVYYDRATGEPVDHYSTYAKCMVLTGISCVISIINIIVCFFKRK